jgi:hypothetical protein
MSRACWESASTAQRCEAEAYAAIVGRVRQVLGLPRRVNGTATPYLDRLASNAKSRDVAAAVFAVAVAMVGRPHAAVAADDLIRLAPEVHAQRMSALDVRNVAVARASRAAQAEKATDLVGYTQTDVLELRPSVVPASPLLSPELIENVTAYAAAVYGRPLTEEMRAALEVGLPCVVDLIESYPGRDPEPGAVLVSMQARQSGREGRHLPTILREMRMPDRVAVALTRVLVGCGCDPQTAILWHALRDTPVQCLPEPTAARLRRDISDLDQAQFDSDLDRARLRRQLTREVHDQRARTGVDSTLSERTAL